MTFPITSHNPPQNSGPCSSFNCLGHFKNVYDDDDDDDDDIMRTAIAGVHLVLFMYRYSAPCQLLILQSRRSQPTWAASHPIAAYTASVGCYHPHHHCQILCPDLRWERSIRQCCDPSVGLFICLSV